MEILIISGAIVLSIISIISCLLFYQSNTKRDKTFFHSIQMLISRDTITQLQGSSTEIQSDSGYPNLSSDMQSSVDDLYSDQAIVSAVLRVIDTGVIILDHHKQLRLINKSARQLLSINSNENLSGLTLAEVTRDTTINDLVNQSIYSGNPQLGITELLQQGRLCNVIVTPLQSHSDMHLAITLNDSTQSRLIDNSQREFVSNVSHELRNPLASIKAMVETLEEGSIHDTTMAINFLGRMSQDIERMINLVNDLLELSRIESGRIRLELQPINLLDIIQEIVSDSNIKHSGESICIRMSGDLQPIDVLADEGRLRQIFINLIENAIRFTDKDGTINIRYMVSHNMVEIHVQDSGIGISPEHHNRIFERFYKVEKARREFGTGLGLSIVKEIVDLHDGTISVQSKEGIGSDFYFTLPIYDVS